MGFIDREALLRLAAPFKRSEYGSYLTHIAQEHHVN